MPERGTAGRGLAFHDSPRARAGRRLDAYSTTVWDIIGSRSTSPGTGDPAGGPEAFLVRADPGFSEAPHFHDVDQYQLFWGGSGSRLGRRAVPSLLLQYVGRHTVYGPIVAGERPLEFMTLRPDVSSLRGRLPEDRDRLVRSARRRRLIDLSEYVASGREGGGSSSSRRSARVPTSGSSVDRLLVAEADGADAAVIRVAAMARYELPAEHRVASYAYVLRGDIVVGDRRFSAGSLAWWGGGDELPDLVTAARGATVLVMSFPHRSVATSHVPKEER